MFIAVDFDSLLIIENKHGKQKVAYITVDRVLLTLGIRRHRIGIHVVHPTGPAVRTAQF